MLHCINEGLTWFMFVFSVALLESARNALYHYFEVQDVDVVEH